MKYTIGADPELFLYDLEKEEFTTVEGIISDGITGTKTNPLVLKDGFSLQEDNVLLEFNIAPASSKQEFIDNNMFMLDAINVFLPDHIVPKIVTSVEMPEHHLITDQALEAGCQEDWNMWTQQKNEKPIMNTNIRGAAGHLHIGWQDATPEECVNVIKKLDIFVGVPSVILDPDTNRRKMYGMAGSARFGRNYSGVEWRVPSNFWLDNKIDWIYDQVMFALNEDINPDEFDVQEIINKSKINEAYELCDKLNINLDKVKA